VQQPDADVQAPFHPTGVLLGLIAGPVDQAGQGQHLIAAVPGLGRGHAIEPGEEHQVLAARQVRVDGQVLGHVAERALGPDRTPDAPALAAALRLELPARTSPTRHGDPEAHWGQRANAVEPEMARVGKRQDSTTIQDAEVPAEAG
jgi:hypothetical protein